jgi:hypothetical protein
MIKFKFVRSSRIRIGGEYSGSGLASNRIRMHKTGEDAHLCHRPGGQAHGNSHGCGPKVS